jgi:Na+-driven multidrug efflux pump
MTVVILWTHRHSDRNPWIIGAFRSLRVPGRVFRQVLVLGLPLMLNELLWSGGMTVLNQCYSVRGLEVVSAMNIYLTISNLFFSAFISTGNATAIMVGQLLGAGELERAVDEDRKLIAFASALSIVLSAMMAATAPFFPLIYNTIPYVRELATKILLISSLMMPLHAFANSCYFTLRSGGKTLITFIFDSGSLWVISVPAAFVIAHYTVLPIIPFFTIVEGLNLIKCVIGYVMVKQRHWVVNLVGSEG